MGELPAKVTGAKVPVIVGGAVALLAVNVMLASMMTDLVTSVLMLGCGYALGRFGR